MTCLLSISCSEDFEEVGVPEESELPRLTNTFKESTVSIKDIPEIGQYLTSKTNKNHFSNPSKNGSDGVLFDLENISKVMDTLNRTNYSISFILSDAPENVIFNLVVGVDSLGEKTNPIIYKYVSNEESVEDWVANDLDFGHFKGTIDIHKYTDYFASKHFAKNECPAEHDEYGDPLPCFSDTVDPGTNGTGGAGSGGGSNGSSGGCTYNMSWRKCGGTDEYSTHGSETCGGDGEGSGWVLETSCPNGTTTTNLFKTASKNDCPGCDVGPSGGVGVNLTNLGFRLKLILQIPNNDLETLRVFQKDEDFTKRILDFLEEEAYSQEAKTAVKISIDAEKANYGGWDFSQTGTFGNRTALKYIATYTPNVGERMYLLEGGLVFYQSASKRRINKKLAGSIAATEVPTNGYNYIYNYPEKKWYEYRMPPTSSPKTDLSYLIDGFWDVAKFVGRYATPLEDGIMLIDGKDWDEVEQNRAQTAGFMIFGFVPGGKVLKPVVRITSNIAKYRKVIKVGESTINLAFEVTNGVVDFGARNSTKFRKTVGLVVGESAQAHHILSRNLRNHRAIQKAAKSGNSFHIDEALNGIPIEAWRNQPNHNLYDQRLTELLNAIPSTLSEDDTYKRIKSIIENVETIIKNNPNLHLNDLNF